MVFWCFVSLFRGLVMPLDIVTFMKYITEIE